MSWYQQFIYFALLLIAATRGMYNCQLHCQYCANHTFSKIKDLDNHERRQHAFAVGVNRRGRNASSDMELCTICNLYLDPGVSLAFSSHLRTSYHLHKLSEYQASSSFDSHSSRAASDVDVTEVDVIALFEKARDVHGFEDDNSGDECNKRLLDENFGEDASDIPVDIGNISHVDWMRDRTDKYLYDLHPDIGYVFLCPFNFDEWSDLRKYPAAALNHDNYARYRFVNIVHGAGSKEVKVALFDLS
jgi:hypothetical protein